MTDSLVKRNYVVEFGVESDIASSSNAEIPVTKSLKAGLAAVVCLAASLACAQSANNFPETHLDAATLRVQNQAEEVYERNDYDRAFFIYRNELVPIGDKYSQYMVGYMYLTGKGVREDRIVASAWYRLAAERGTKEFIFARDRVMAKLNDVERAESDRLFVELRKEYGDLALLTKAIRRDYEELRERTGSRVSADSSPMAIVDLTGAGVAQSGTEYYRVIERRLQARLDYIAKRTEIGIIDVDTVESSDIDAIERQVAVQLDQIN